MLSEFTGSSNLLLCKGNGALLINPWDIKKFSETFKELLTMSPEERRNAGTIVTTLFLPVIQFIGLKVVYILLTVHGMWIMPRVVIWFHLIKKCLTHFPL